MSAIKFNNPMSKLGGARRKSEVTTNRIYSSIFSTAENDQNTVSRKVHETGACVKQMEQAVTSNERKVNLNKAMEIIGIAERSISQAISGVEVPTVTQGTPSRSGGPSI